jgi:hypothetical protein
VGAYIYYRWSSCRVFGDCACAKLAIAFTSRLRPAVERKERTADAPDECEQKRIRNGPPTQSVPDTACDRSGNAADRGVEERSVEDEPQHRLSIGLLEAARCPKLSSKDNLCRSKQNLGTTGAHRS